MKKVLMLFCIGASGYYWLEILCRGYSHWSMAIAGGICLVAMYGIHKQRRINSIFLKALMSAVVITVVELVIGLIVNLKYQMNVWSYEDMYLNYKGQICLLYSVIWFGLAFFVLRLLNSIERKKAMDVSNG